MKCRRKLLLLVVMLSTTLTYAQDIKVKVNEKGKTGYEDASGRVILDCKYDAALPFERGFGKVMKGDKFGLVNASGQFVIPIKYDEINYDEKAGFFRVKSGKAYGIISTTGQVLQKPVFTFISQFNCYGKALVAVGGKPARTDDKRSYLEGAKYNVMNTDGMLIGKDYYYGLFEFISNNEGTYPYYRGKSLDNEKHFMDDTLKTACRYLGFSKMPYSTREAGLLGEHGEVLIKTGVYTWIFEPHSEMVRYYNTAKKNFSIGYYNLQTKRDLKCGIIQMPINQCKFWSHSDYTGEIAHVNIGGKWKFIDRQGTTLKEGFTNVKQGEASKAWAAFTGNSCIVLDYSGYPLLRGETYEDVNFATYDADADYFAVKKDGKWGVINRSTSVLIPFEHASAYAPYYGIAFVKDEGGWGARSLTNEELVPSQFLNIYFPSSANPTNLWVQKQDQLYYNFNLKDKAIVGEGFLNIKNFKDGYAWARPKGMHVPYNYLNDALVDLDPLVAAKKAELEKAQQNQKRKTAVVVNRQEVFRANLNKFGYIIDTANQKFFQLPITSKYTAEAVELIKEKKRPLTDSEAQNLLLQLTSSKRTYKITDKLGEENWDY